MTVTAVGADACRGGWFAVVLVDGQPPRGVFAGSLADLAAQVPDADGFAVDIPIGLPTAGVREADRAAAAFVGPRRSSVFLTPIREAVQAASYEEASRRSRERTGMGVSRQAYALVPRILEASRWAGAVAAPVWEAHPEVTFTEMLGHPPRHPKRTWAGMRERFVALEAAGVPPTALDDVEAPVAVDDVLDAAAVAWSARRLVRGAGRCLPDPPERDPDTGEAMAIWV